MKADLRISIKDYRRNKKNPTHPASLCGQMPVLGENERRAVAQSSPAGFAHSLADGSAQIAGEVGSVLRRSAWNKSATSPTSRFCSA